MWKSRESITKNKNIIKKNQEDFYHENKDSDLQNDRRRVFFFQNRIVQSGLSFCRVRFWRKCGRKVGLVRAILWM